MKQAISGGGASSPKKTRPPVPERPPKKVTSQPAPKMSLIKQDKKMSLIKQDKKVK